MKRYAYITKDSIHYKLLVIKAPKASTRKGRMDSEVIREHLSLHINDWVDGWSCYNDQLTSY